jgi:hypothetical protein
MTACRRRAVAPNTRRVMIVRVRVDPSVNELRGDDA